MSGVGAVGQDWPDGGPWVLVPTSAAVGWEVVATTLAAAAAVRVAVVALGAEGPPGEGLLDHLATWAELRDGAADPLSLDETTELVSTLARTHGLVLVAGAQGLLVPAGRAGWTVADLAVALGAPVAVIAGDGPDAANHTTMALGVLDARGLTGAVISVGAEPVDTPLEPAGHIPPGAADQDDPAAARALLHPMLHASAGRPKSATPPPAAPPPPTVPGPATSGKRVVLLLGAVFITMSLMVTGLAFCERSAPQDEATMVTGFDAPAPAGTAWNRPSPAARPPRPPSAICPEYRTDVTPAKPVPAVTARVDAAWRRIEKWLAAKVPAARDSLRPPAAAEAVQGAQQRMSVAFPPDLVASLLRHDGAEAGGFELPFTHRPMSTAEIPGRWWEMCAVTVADDEWWNKRYVPFAAAGDGGYLLIDQRPGNHGRVGEFYNESGADFTRWPASIADLLELTATSLETGRPFAGRYRPVVTDGALDWEVVVSPSSRPSR